MHFDLQVVKIVLVATIASYRNHKNPKKRTSHSDLFRKVRTFFITLARSLLKNFSFQLTFAKFVGKPGLAERSSLIKHSTNKNSQEELQRMQNAERSSTNSNNQTFLTDVSFHCTDIF